MLNYLDLFSGIGGFALGAYWAGFRCDNHYFSEIEKYPSDLYKLRFPDAIALGDITKINGKDLPNGEWIITGGFPCQDISTAGKGAGLDGARSGLWFEYARLISELRPSYAIMENVGALVTRGLDRVLGSLSEIGYDAEWIDIRASDLGAPHKRERIWIMAYPGLSKSQRRDEVKEGQQHSIGREAWSKPTSCRDVAYPNREHGKRRSESQLASSPSGEARDQLGWGGEDAADSSGSGLKELHVPTKPTWKRHGAWCGDENMAHAASGIKSFPLHSPGNGREWKPISWDAPSELVPEPTIRRVVDGVSTRLGRLKGLGNSIVPQIAQLIFEAIMDVDNGNDMRYH